MDILTLSNLKTKEIIFSKPVKNESKFKIKIYVIDKIGSKKFNKLGLISPIVELNINWKNLKYQSFKFSLEPLIGQNLDIYNIISELENISLNELVKIFGDNCNFKSIISEINYSDDLFIDNNLFTTKMITFKLLKNTTIFDSNGKKNDFTDIKQSEIFNYRFLIELNELWYDTETSLCGCNFYVVQIKYFPLYYNVDLIFDENKIVKPKSSLPLPPPPPPKAKSIPPRVNIIEQVSINKENPKPSNASISMVIDENMLKSALSRLKKPP
jgi:hypothetical protein